MPKARADDLLFVSKSPKERLDFLAAGASLVTRTGYGISDLRKRAAADRLKLAAAFLRDARRVSKASPTLHRTTISRAYYSMYHAVRAATFLSYGGDDHEQHTVLPSKIPTDFPDAIKWQNKLKGARFERNKADYDPYPRRDKDFEGIASTLLLTAVELLEVTRSYIQAKS